MSLKRGIKRFVLFIIFFLALSIILVLATTPYISLNSPINNSATIDSWALLNITIYDLDLNTIDVYIYGDNTTNPWNYSLLYKRIGLSNGTQIIYNWTSLVLNLTSNTTVLMHFDNITNKDNETRIYNEFPFINGTKKSATEPSYNSSGKFGWALTFDGVDDYVQLFPNNSFQNLQEGTIEAWIYPYTSTTGTIFSVKENEADNQDMFLFYLYGGRLVAGLKKGNAFNWLGTGDATITNNTWHYVAVTVNSSGNAMYVDGIQQTITYTNALNNASFIGDLPPPPPSAIQTNYIGKAVWSNTVQQVFNGSIDEFAIYNRSLTPSEILDHYRLTNATYYWKVLVVDPTSQNFSDIREFTIGYDWIVSPLDLGTHRVNISNSTILGNITINNSGLRDLNITFNISSNYVPTNYSIDFYFNLSRDGANSNSTKIEVNATAPATSGIFDIVLTIYANLTETWNEAVPYMQNVTARLVSTAGDPFLEANIDEYPISVLRGESVNLTATITNQGSGLATDVYLWFELPTGWSISEGDLNKSLGNLSVGYSNYTNITVTVGSTANLGFQNIIVNSSGSNETGDIVESTFISGDSVSIDVREPISAPSETSVSTPSSIGGGGGGTSVKSVQSFEVLRGNYKIVPIKIDNIYTNSILKNVKISIDGYLSQHIKVSPETLNDIPFGASKDFNLNIFVPTYFEKEDFNLKLIITGDIVAVEPNRRGDYEIKKLFEEKIIKLIIREVDTTEAKEYLNNIEKYIQDMKDFDYPYSSLNILNEKALESFKLLDYETIRLLEEEAKSIRDNAFESDSLIKDLQSLILESEDKWLDLPETKKSLELAMKAFQREDFIVALQRAKDTQLIYVLETRGKLNLLWLAYNYWWALILGTFVLFIILLIGYKKLNIFIINQRINNIDKEEEGINKLFKDLQREFLVDKKISELEYSKSSDQYKDRLNKIRQIRLKLRNKRVGIVKTEQELVNLKQEKEEIIRVMKELQRDYLVKSKMSRAEFLSQDEKYKRRLAELEEEQQFTKEKLQKNKSVGWYKLVGYFDDLLGRKIENKKYKGKWVKLKIKDEKRK